jgi:Ca-activated chloride channel homolog
MSASGNRVWFQIILAFAALLSSASSVAQSQDQSKEEKDLTISVDVRRVVLYATVRDAKLSSLVGDLKQEDFSIRDNGHPEQIRQFKREDVPVAIGLILDNSQSMMTKRNDVIAAAKTFVRTSNPHDEMFVLHFSDDLRLGLPPDVPFTSDHAMLEEALEHITAMGRTALYDGILAGLRHLQESTLTKKALVVISDGGDNASLAKFPDLVKAAGISGALFYGIGIYDPLDGDAKPGVIRHLASETGGASFFPQSVEEVTGLCESIARDLRNQYMLEYAPESDSKDASFHKVEVRVKDPKHRHLIIRTRTGYYGPAAERGFWEKLPK